MRSRIARAALAGRIPLIGFAGAPFTLAAYLIEGGASKHYQATKAFMYGAPAAFRLLMEKLTDLSAASLNAQIEAGVQAVQVFDSWVGVLGAADYAEYVMDHSARLFASLDRSVPSIHFGVDTFHLLPLIGRAGGDVIGVDWRVPIDMAWEAIGHDRAIQGNLDPAALLGPAARLEEQVREIVRRAGTGGGHIFNLGHGVLPETPPEAVEPPRAEGPRIRACGVNTQVFLVNFGAPKDGRRRTALFEVPHRPGRPARSHRRA